MRTTFLHNNKANAGAFKWCALACSSTYGSMYTITHTHA